MHNKTKKKKEENNYNYKKLIFMFITIIRYIILFKLVLGLITQNILKKMLRANRTSYLILINNYDIRICHVSTISQLFIID